MAVLWSQAYHTPHNVSAYSLMIVSALAKPASRSDSNQTITARFGDPAQSHRQLIGPGRWRRIRAVIVAGKRNLTSKLDEATYRMSAVPDNAQRAEKAL